MQQRKHTAWSWWGPVCVYEDIETIQEIVRRCDANSALVNDSCGIHVHVKVENSMRSICGTSREYYGREELIYKALQVDLNRSSDYCRRVEQRFPTAGKRAETAEPGLFGSIWYNGRTEQCALSRKPVHTLNLHSVFQKGTVEFRMLNPRRGKK